MKRAGATLGVGALAAFALGTCLNASAAEAEAGKTAYMTYCVSCHGEKGDGKGIVGVTLDPPPRDFSSGAFMFDPDQDGKKGTDADLKAVIKNGAAAYGGSVLMTPWAHLQPQEVDNLIAYIRTLQEQGAIPVGATAESKEP